MGAAVEHSNIVKCDEKARTLPASSMKLSETR